MPINYGRHLVDEEDVAAVVEVLRGEFLTQGPKVAEFEEALASLVGVKHAVAFSSGTAALHAAYFAAGVGPGDEVIVPPMTFVATANAALYLGGRPVFADVSPKTWCLDPERAREAISPRTRVVAPVDYAGFPVDLRPFREMCEERGLVLVEDAAHALGASRGGVPVGKGAHMTVLSFHPVKHITTGEGGAVLTDEDRFARRLRLFRTHGITRDPSEMTRFEGPWYYEMVELGYNYRITDLQCALGLSQLKKLPRFLERRREIARRYVEALGAVDGLELPPLPEGGISEHAFHIFPVLLPEGVDRLKLFEAMRAEGINPQVHYIPAHLHPYYRRSFGHREGDFPVSELIYSRELTLPLHPSMGDGEVERVLKVFLRSLQDLRP